jgi:intracellular septation protein
MTAISMDEPGRSRLNPIVKLALELGPLVVFFLGNSFAEKFGVPADRKIIVATAVFVVATLLSLLVHFILVRRLPIMPMVSGVVVVIFGGLTIALNDAIFIKLKPTIVNTLFGIVLLGGAYWKKPVLATVLDSMFNLTEEGWHKLTIRWGLFFFVLAILNEIVWRTQTDDVWVQFKTFGIMPLTVVFALAQTPLLMRYERPAAEAAPKG